MDLGSLHTANFCLFVLVIVLFETTILDSSVLAVVLSNLLFSQEDLCDYKKYVVKLRLYAL